METVYLSLGSNIGDRQYYLHEAIDLLGKNSKILIDQVSKFYETSPVGGVKQDDFVNLALKISTTLNPVELLDIIHDIELTLNRERKIHWGPRTIDIDILFYGELSLNEPNLTIPHKEIFNRLFVLLPLSELISENFNHYSEVMNGILKLRDTGQEVHEVTEEANSEQRIERAVHEILQAVGEDTEREGLLETPNRVAKMYAEILSSQRLPKFTEYKLFTVEEVETDQTVLVKDIPFYSMCEHHMLPFFGKIHVAYIPQNGKVIGLSKIPRLVNYVTRRLSVQEDVTRQVAEILTEILNPKGVAVVAEARHMCVEMRGVEKINSLTKTTFFMGEFDKNPEKRMEFLESLH